jgi:hypothetical protein
MGFEDRVRAAQESGELRAEHFVKIRCLETMTTVDELIGEAIGKGDDKALKYLQQRMSLMVEFIASKRS